MKLEPRADGSDLSGFLEVGGPFVAVARNPVPTSPSSVMNLRRLIRDPISRRIVPYHTLREMLLCITAKFETKDCCGSKNETANAVAALRAGDTWLTARAGKSCLTTAVRRPR